MKNIAVRLWNNQRFGTTYGKGLRRKAYFNGTIQIAIPPIKYLIDLEPFDYWHHHTKNPIHLKMLQKYNFETFNDSNVLMSWIVRYEDGVKTAVEGFCCFDLNGSGLLIHIVDPEYKLEDTWELKVRECLNKTPGKPTPNLIATNYELEKLSVQDLDA